MRPDQKLFVISLVLVIGGITCIFVEHFIEHIPLNGEVTQLRLAGLMLALLGLALGFYCDVIKDREAERIKSIVEWI